MKQNASAKPHDKWCSQTLIIFWTIRLISFAWKLLCNCTKFSSVLKVERCINMTFSVIDIPMGGFHMTCLWRKTDNATLFSAPVIQQHTLIMSLLKINLLSEHNHIISYSVCFKLNVTRAWSHNTNKIYVCVCVCTHMCLLQNPTVDHQLPISRLILVVCKCIFPEHLYWFWLFLFHWTLLCIMIRIPFTHVYLL